MHLFQFVEVKLTVAKPFAEGLKKRGLTVWLDEQELRLGDQPRQKINQGLNCSRYGVVILSRSFFAKSWPQEELDTLLGKESFGEKSFSQSGMNSPMTKSGVII